MGKKCASAMVGLFAVTLIGMIVATCVVADEPAVEQIEIVISPNTMVLDSQGVWVTVHADISYYAVDKINLQLNGIEVAWTKSDNLGDLVVKFSLDEVKEIVSPPSAELTLTGYRNDGTPFVGTDSIRVSNGSNK